MLRPSLAFAPASGPSATRTFLSLSLAFYVLAIGLGLLLRVSFLQPLPWLHFGHALHAHSHTLYFGWAGLGLLTLAFEQVGASGRGVTRVLTALAVTSGLTFVAFLYGGYAAPGMAVSTLALVVWAVAVGVWWRAARGASGLEVRFLRAGMAYVVLALAGAITRVVLLATGWGTPFHARLSVFVFLHAFAVFFLFTTLAVLIAHARARGARVDERELGASLWLLALTVWLGAPLGVAGGEEGVLGALARAAALVGAVAGAVWVRSLWRLARDLSGTTATAYRCLAVWYALKVGMEVAGGLGLATWAARARQPTLLYLHVLLVGFVSLGLLIPLLTRLGRPLARGLMLHNVGLLLMAGGLALLGAGAGGIAWAAAWLPRGYTLAAVGAAPLVLAGVLWLWPATKPRRETAGSRVRPHSSASAGKVSVPVAASVGGREGGGALLMKGHVLFDGRNIFDPVRVKEEGFTSYGIGRS